MSVTLKYHGHSCFSIAGGGVVIDPFLSENPSAKERPADIKCEGVLVTHAHSDHLGDAIQVAKANNAVLVATYELALYCQRQGVEKVFPMHIGGGHDFEFGHVKLTVAQHGSAIVTDDDIICFDNACGFLVTVEGKKLYHAGDTGLCADMELLGRLNQLDVAMLPIGDVFTMGMDDAVIAAGLLGAGLTVPMHYGTYPVIPADPEEYVARVQKNGLQARVMQTGDEIEV